eukprot:GAFH01006194.1.p1 GENE.GAFH01006194.1~~GAFH01006194.1.p1  ORF type:complete len:149 (-),score=5.51 GAFH01006194.1:74-484(-)
MSFDLKDEIWALGRLFPAVTVQDRVVHLPFVMGAVKCTITFNLPEGYPTDLPVISIEPGHEGLKDSEGRLVEALQAKAAEQKGDYSLFSLAEEAQTFLGSIDPTALPPATGGCSASSCAGCSSRCSQFHGEELEDF